MRFIKLPYNLWLFILNHISNYNSRSTKTDKSIMSKLHFIINFYHREDLVIIIICNKNQMQVDKAVEGAPPPPLRFISNADKLLPNWNLCWTLEKNTDITLSSQSYRHTSDTDCRKAIHIIITVGLYAASFRLLEVSKTHRPVRPSRLSARPFSGHGWNTNL